jgi:hypothetical protein
LYFVGVFVRFRPQLQLSLCSALCLLTLPLLNEKIQFVLHNIRQVLRTRRQSINLAVIAE